MFDLDTLRPEVREAAAKLDDFDSAFGTGGRWQIIRAELLRLATIEADALIALDCEHDWQVEHKRAEKAEAELAALKKRIAEARMETVNKPQSYWGQEASFGIVTALVDAKLIGSPVRILVGDDDAKA